MQSSVVKKLGVRSGVVQLDKVNNSQNTYWIGGKGSVQECAMNSSNEIDVDSDSHQKSHKKTKKRKSRRNRGGSSSQSRSNSLRRRSTSSCYGQENDERLADVSHRMTKTPSNNIVEYSDVSSSEFSDPEAGEIDSDKSLIICEGPITSSIGKKRQNDTSSRISHLSTQRQDVRLNVNISSDEENTRFVVG